MAKQPTDNLIVSSSIEELGKHVPMKALQELVDSAKKLESQEASNHGITKEGLLLEVRQLVESKKISTERVSTLTKNYKFAGRISVCWGIPLRWTSFKKTQIESIILEKYPVNPFEEEIKPQLTQKPSFNKTEWLGEDLLRLEFAYAGKSYVVEDNYQSRVIIPTKRINSYLRLLEKTFVVETRASIRESRLVQDAVSRLLGIEIIPMTFSNQDMKILKQDLEAKSKAAKHKRHGGDLDTVYVSAAPNLEDLDNSEEYKEHFTHGELKEARLEFIYKSSNCSINVALHISNQGNIWFMTDIPEETIDYVFEIVRRIKFLPSIKSLDLPSPINNDDEARIQSLINSIREKGFGNRFNPRIYKTLDIDVDERKWFETISKLVRLGHVLESLELVCPLCHETLEIYSNYKDLPLGDTIHCSHCSHEFEVSEHDILLNYSFREDFDQGQVSQISPKEAQIELMSC
jgi:hypothetical protein